MESPRHVRIERGWGEVNPKVLYAPKTMLITMEADGTLNPHNSYHIGAVQMLLRPLLQLGLDNFAFVHHNTRVRSVKGHGGKPHVLRSQHPHPNEASLVPYDPTHPDEALYEQASGRRLPLPDWLRQRDPLDGQPLRQAARNAAVMAIWGSPTHAWQDILHTLGRHRFIPSFRMFVLFR